MRTSSSLSSAIATILHRLRSLAIDVLNCAAVRAPKTDETVLGLIDQIAKNHNGTEDEQDRYASSATQAIVHADVKVVERHASQILDLDGLDDKAKDTVCQRVRFSTQSPEDLWIQLTDFCTRSDQRHEVPADLGLAYDLAEALGRHPQFVDPRILPILAQETGDEEKWLESFAVRLAGETKLHKAVAHIVKLLESADDWIFEEGERALSKIGGDEVVEMMGRTFPACGFGFRISAAAILETIHSDLTVETSLRLAQTEEDPDSKGHLIQAGLMNFSTDAIEPARQFVLATPLTPEVLEARRDLLVACKVMGETFPELAAWIEDAKNDAEFRGNWYRKYPFFASLFNEDAELDDELDGELDDEEYEPLPPPDTIIRDVRVGRSEPCPCGSGKKFKKCCLGKRSAV